MVAVVIERCPAVCIDTWRSAVQCVGGGGRRDGDAGDGGLGPCEGRGSGQQVSFDRQWLVLVGAVGVDDGLAAHVLAAAAAAGDRLNAPGAGPVEGELGYELASGKGEDAGAETSEPGSAGGEDAIGVEAPDGSGVWGEDLRADDVAVAGAGTVLAGTDELLGAAELHLGTGTVKTHVAATLSKLNLRDRTQAAILAHEAGLV